MDHYLVICPKRVPDENEVVQTDQAEVNRKEQYQSDIFCVSFV